MLSMLERVKELLHYDPATGLFHWKVYRNSQAQAGEQAGCVDSVTGYVRIRIDLRKYPAHRLAVLLMTGQWPEHQVDHRNGNRADNRWVNLRPATSRQNAHHTIWPNSHGFKGVNKQSRCRSRPYIARINVNGVRRSLGYYATAEEAYAVYCKAADEAFGEFASY
jgi:hypothetical protein